MLMYVGHSGRVFTRLATKIQWRLQQARAACSHVTLEVEACGPDCHYVLPTLHPHCRVGCSQQLLCLFPTNVLFKEYSTVEDDVLEPKENTVAKIDGLICHMCMACGNAAPSSFQPTRVMT